MNSADPLAPFRIRQAPNYLPQHDEIQVFEAAFHAGLSLIVKGPTGCGKTRFIEFMAHSLDLPLITVSCHEDLTAADLVGRFLFREQQTRWQDGPLALAARYGAICYLDEIVEARKDTTVIIHSLTDDRRMLYIDKTGEVIHAHPRFMMVLSYNPGYQSVVKDLKPSTRQRFVATTFDHPESELEARILHSESKLPALECRKLAEMGAKIRELKGFGLEEGVSTRLLAYAARLMHGGLDPQLACRVAISEALTEDPDVLRSVNSIVQLYFGDLMKDAILEEVTCEANLSGRVEGETNGNAPASGA